MSDSSVRDPSVAASDPTRSVWVAAHAGAGKTHTLASRVARLLLADTRPERILCLTFTKAAAAEMQGRLFRQLGAWAMLDDASLTDEITRIGGGADDLPKARRLFAQALETPGGLKVLTIHAFCQGVLSRFPLEAGIAPGFEVLDEASARGLVGEARRAVLERAGRGDALLASALAHLVTETSEARAGQVLDAALAADRRKLDRFFGAVQDEARAHHVRRAHGAGAEETTSGVAADFCGQLRAEIAQLRDARAWLGDGSASDKKLAVKLTAFLAADFGEGSFQLLAAAMLTEKGEPVKKLATKKLAEARADLANYLEDLQRRFCGAQERYRATRAARLAEAALTLIAAVRGEYAAAKRRRGVLDYDDLIVETRTLLERRGAAQWVLFKLDNGIDHVLVDEAQDTSPEQWAILRKLTEEFFAGEGRARITRTLFAVGDEKQSIFSFQGADPAQFDINRRHFRALAEAGGHPFLDQPLEMSRRSAPEILSFVDSVFESAGARRGLTSSEAPLRHLPFRTQAKGGIVVWPPVQPLDVEEKDIYRPLDAPQPESPVIALATRIAERIKAWRDSGATLPGHDAPITPGDIMILLPRREPFGSEVIRQLKQRGVPVAGADRILLTEQIAAMDLMALGHFAIQREDDLNLAALLRSPLCGLEEDQLYALAHNRAGDLWSALAAASDPVFTRAHDFLSAMLSVADYAPPFEFYSHALSSLGAKEKLLARLGAESADAIDEFLSRALAYERGGTPSLQGFLDWLARGGTEIKRDMERGRNEVRVMTVHGAKGLEADIVFLPDTTTLREPGTREGHLLYDGEDVLFPLPAKDAPQRVRDAQETLKSAWRDEHRRLFYVALTRARERLVICGFENRHGTRDGSWYSLAAEAAQRVGAPLINEDGWSIGALDEHHTTSPVVAVPEAPLPDWLRRPAPPEEERPRLIRPSDAVDESTALSPRDLARFKRGLVVHALLARLPETDAARRAEVARAFARAQGFGTEDADALVTETLAVLDDPQFAAVFGPASRAEAGLLAEVPELGPGARVNGRIDRLAVTDDEVLILDFKTNRPPPAEEAQVSPLYLGQMALYRAGAARIFPGRRIVCGLLFTDGPRLMRLSDTILDTAWAVLRARLTQGGSVPK